MSCERVDLAKAICPQTSAAFSFARDKQGVDLDLMLTYCNAFIITLPPLFT